MKVLLKKYILGNISVHEYKDLKHISSETDDDVLSDTFESIWAEYDHQTMNSDIKEEVRLSLRNEIAPRKRITFNWKNIAAAVLLPALFLSTTYLLLTQNTNQTTQEFVVASAKGQKTEIYLPDGTKVWLNSGSTLTYNSEYNQNNRIVKLKGEAFFDVEKKESQRFVVETGDATITVYGTAFNVLSYENDSTISVSLNRGKVKVENSKSHTQIAELSPNQQLIINKKNSTSRLLSCDAELQSLWTQNKLKLENATTEELFGKMEHWYGVNIHIENTNSHNRYALTIKTESLHEILDLINKITPITYNINGEEVRIRYVN